MLAGSIIVYPDSPESFAIEIEAGEILEIGRKQTTSGNKKLVIPVPEISGQHAEIKPSLSGWTIRDFGSTNGTCLNGDRLSPGKEYRLLDGDRILIAHVELLIQLSAEQQDLISESSDVIDKTYAKINLINATILVADIRSFSSLTEIYADKPDVVMQAFQLVFLCIKEEIAKANGQLEKIAGDAIMAYWQSDESGVSQARQACHAALRLRALVKAIGQKEDCWPFPNFPLMLDLALATGPVATGALGHPQSNHELLGDTPNLAFRLEKLIGQDNPGDIVVDEKTQKLAGESFLFKFLGEFNIKGRQRPVNAYRLLAPNNQVTS